MENIAESNLSLLEEQTSDELADDELEQVSGGVLPVLVAAGIKVAVASGAAAFVAGAVTGFLNGETEEEDRCHGRK